MGMDPVTLGLITAGGGAALGAIGDYRAQSAQNRRQRGISQRADQLWQQPGSNPYQSQVDQLIAGLPDAMHLDPNSGNIDISAILSSINPGQDALAQFLRADPYSKLLGDAGGRFDVSSAFDMLQGNDQMQLDRLVAGQRAGYSGLGQRFGTAAQRNEGRLRADFGAQVAARNAGIAQTAYESEAQRRLQAATQGLGFQLQGAQGLASTGVNAAQIAAGLATSNQSNQFNNNQFNLNAQQQAYLQRLNAIQSAFGMNQQTLGYNRDLLAIMAGLPVGGGGGWSAAGQGAQDIGQLLMFLPFLQNAGKPRTQGGTP